MDTITFVRDAVMFEKIFLIACNYVCGIVMSMLCLLGCTMDAIMSLKVSYALSNYSRSVLQTHQNLTMLATRLNGRIADSEIVLIESRPTVWVWFVLFCFCFLLLLLFFCFCFLVPNKIDIIIMSFLERQQQ